MSDMVGKRGRKSSKIVGHHLWTFQQSSLLDFENFTLDHQVLLSFLIGGTDDKPHSNWLPPPLPIYKPSSDESKGLTVA